MNFIKRLLEKYPVSTLYVILFLSVILFFVSYFQKEDSDIWLAFNKLSELGISGGIFAVILKSNQFVTVFKDVVSSVLNGHDALENRKDLEKVWGNVTQTLSDRKFKNISGLLHDNIKSYFLPINKDYYYKDFNVKIDIEYISDKPGYIKITEILSYSIICDNVKKKIPSSFKVKIKVNNKDKDIASFRLDELKINGEDKIKLLKDPKFNQIDKDYLISSYTLDLQGASEYKLRRKSTRIYSMNFNPVKTYQAVWLYHNLSFNISYPKDLTLNVKSLGLLGDLSIENNNNSSNYNNLEVDYKGIVYKNQGIYMFFNKHV